VEKSGYKVSGACTALVFETNGATLLLDSSCVKCQVSQWKIPSFKTAEPVTPTAEEL
jgi:hypothetical protein